MRGRNRPALDDDVQCQRLRLTLQEKCSYRSWTIFKSFSNSQPSHTQLHRTAFGSVCLWFSVIWVVPCPESCTSKNISVTEYFAPFICLFYLTKMVITFCIPHTQAHTDINLENTILNDLFQLYPFPNNVMNY